MKKNYVAPESKLYALKLNENIADSVEQGDDEVSGMFVISFTENTSPCRGLYSGIPNMENTLGMEATFAAYYAQLQGYGNADLWGCLTIR